jgi:hypothetical protein
MRMPHAALIVIAVSGLTLSVAGPGVAAHGMGPFRERAGSHYGSVVAVSPDSAFFAGAHGAQRRPRFKQWDGQAWSNVVGIPGKERGAAAIDADGPDDAWAVGSTPHGTLITHWDGAAWRVVHDGGLGHGSESFLYGVSVVAPDDVWVAGTEVRSYTSIVKHWDGSTWQLVPVPVHAFLMDVAATGPKDVWVVGEVPFQGWQFLHWDGQTWTTFPADEPHADAIESLDALASDDVWAVGLVDHDGDPGTLVEHWDGASWTVVPTPDPGAPFAELKSVSAVSPDDVWAAGVTGDPSGRIYGGLIEHWNGKGWSVVPHPEPGDYYSVLPSISADSATDAWASGVFSNRNHPDEEKTLLMHWDGKVWTRLHHVR